MTTAFSTRGPLRSAARLGLAGAALLAAVHGAAAEGDGLDFLTSIFRPLSRSQAQPVQQPEAVQRAAPARGYDSGYLRASVPHHRVQFRPLIVRLHPAKPKTVVAQVPTKPGKVSVFEDRTLRQGDAVMMAGGVRVFAGSASFPYLPQDFVALKDAKSLDRDTSKVLAQLDKLPRG